MAKSLGCLKGREIIIMDISDLKKLIKNSASVLVMDNGEPSFIIIGYQMYKDLVADRGGEKEVKIRPVRSSLAGGDSIRSSSTGTFASQVPFGDSRSRDASETSKGTGNGYVRGVDASHDHERETEILERLNKEILALKSQIEAEEKGLTNQHPRDID